MNNVFNDTKSHNTVMVCVIWQVVNICFPFLGACKTVVESRLPPRKVWCANCNCLFSVKLMFWE